MRYFCDQCGATVEYRSVDGRPKAWMSRNTYDGRWWAFCEKPYKGYHTVTKKSDE